MPMTTEALLATPEVARRLGITARQVYELIDRGDLAFVKTERGLVRVPISAVALYQERQTR